MKLNFEKVKVVGFFKRSKKFDTAYQLNDVCLKNDTLVKDMGILFDCQLTFKPHIDLIVNSSLGALGGITRISSNFNNINTLKLL